MIIPTKDKKELFMRMVYEYASQSKDPKTKIGAVLVKDDIHISGGYNNFPRGVEDDEERYLDRGTKYALVVHGEHNCILNACRSGMSTLGATLYTQGVPCNECMKAVINSGIKKIVIHKQWPTVNYSEKWSESNKWSLLMKSEAGITIEVFDRVLNMKGLLDGKEINV